jgi:hypothetical protein
MKIQNAIGRFVEKLYIEDETGCRLFLGAKSPGGYCTFHDENGRIVLAHKWAFTHLTNREIPEGMELGHICPKGTRRDCMNPRHMKPMSHQQNCQYASKEGRLGKSTKPCKPILPAELEDIQSSHAKGESASSIAKRLKRSPSHIGSVVKGKVKPRKPKPVVPVRTKVNAAKDRSAA